MRRTLYYSAKDPGERDYYPVDWSGVLTGGDTIDDSAWTAVGAAKGAEEKTATTTKLWLDPDPAQADVVTLTNTITTVGGGSYVQTIILGLAEPISLEFVKERLAITSNHRDEEIVQLMAAARWHVEDYTGLILTRRQVVETLDSFGPIITLRSWPIISLDSIGYLDEDDAPQEVLGSRVRLGQRPARLFPPASPAFWPRTAHPAEVTITVTAGFDHTLPMGHPDGVPAPLVTSMLLLIGHWLENRETVVIGTIAADLPNGWMALAHPYRRLI